MISSGDLLRSSDLIRKISETPPRSLSKAMNRLGVAAVRVGDSTNADAYGLRSGGRASGPFGESSATSWVQTIEVGASAFRCLG